MKVRLSINLYTQQENLGLGELTFRVPDEMVSPMTAFLKHWTNQRLPILRNGLKALGFMEDKETSGD